MKNNHLPWVEKMPDDAYHGEEMQGYVSSTQLKTLAHSPAHLRHMMDNPMVETDALRQGKAIHCAILDGPEEFARQYKERTVPDWRTVAGKAEKAAMERDGVTCLTADEHAMIMGIYHAFESHPVLMDIIATDPDPKFEHAILWQDKETGLWCRAKPDIFGANFMLDLKSTKDARPHKFNRQFFELGYHIQAAHYASAWEAINGQNAENDLDFVFFAAEKTPPFGHMLYRVSRDVMLYGKQCRRDLMLKFADCLNMGEWHGYGNEIKELTLPWGMGGGNDDDEDCE